VTIVEEGRGKNAGDNDVSCFFSRRQQAMDLQTQASNPLSETPEPSAPVHKHNHELTCSIQRSTYIQCDRIQILHPYLKLLRAQFAPFHSLRTSQNGINTLPPPRIPRTITHHPRQTIHFTTTPRKMDTHALKPDLDLALHLAASRRLGHRLRDATAS
jgi:hypothetical protein